MKKYLLASSALASVALVSGLALAEASVSGNVRAGIILASDALTGPAAYIDDADISVDGSGTTDNGWDYAANISIDLDSGEGPGSSDAVNFDNLSISLSGGFGQVALDHGDNAAGNMDIHGGAVAAATGGFDGNARSGFNGFSTGAQGVSNALSYYSNNLSGLTFGISLGLGGQANDSGTKATKEVPSVPAVAPDSSTTPKTVAKDKVDAIDAVKAENVKSISGNAIGVKYSGGGLSAAFTTGSETTESTTDTGLRSVAGKAVANEKVENSGTSIGVSYSVGALSFAFGMASIEGKTQVVDVEIGDITSGSDATILRATERTYKGKTIETASTSFGVSYNHGAGAVSLTSVSSTRTIDSKEDKNGSNLLAVGYDRTLGEGIVVYAEYFSGTYPIGKTNTGEGALLAKSDGSVEYDSGTELLLGTKISF